MTYSEHRVLEKLSELLLNKQSTSCSLNMTGAYGRVRRRLPRRANPAP